MHNLILDNLLLINHSNMLLLSLKFSLYTYVTTNNFNILT